MNPKAPRPDLYRLSGFRLRLVFVIVRYYRLLDSLDRWVKPDFNLFKFLLLFPLCMAGVIVCYAPPAPRLPDLVALWAWSLLVTISLYRLLPEGRRHA